jgi:pyruvate/2-oxoglutarate dehydrogenase complex dihydrolipoamide acyltransferase (E2) component
VGVAKEVLLPDIGDFENVEVIEILVSVGDRVAVDDSLIVLESDKATMEIPSPFAGVVREIRVAQGDLVSRGALIAILEVEEAVETAAPLPPEGPQLSAAATEPEPAPAAEAAQRPPETEPPRRPPFALPSRRPPRRRRSNRFPGTRSPAESRTPAPRCADSPASSASIFGWSRRPDARDGPARRTSRPT